MGEDSMTAGDMLASMSTVDNVSASEHLAKRGTYIDKIEIEVEELQAFDTIYEATTSININEETTTINAINDIITINNND